MFLKTLVVGAIETNCYLVACPETREAAVIDPGAEGQRILQAVAENGLRVKYIINTHGHGDHIAANGTVKEATGAEILIHQDDAVYLTDPKKSLLAFMGANKPEPPADRTLREGDVVEIGATVRLEVIHTPGHTPGGICLKAGNVIFAGDTLFAGSVGRTDFPGGSYSKLISSIKEKLLRYQDDVEVYPGHGPGTTIGEERAYNPYLS